MTTFKILFVIALAVPAAVCLYYLLNNMMNEFAVVKKNKNANIDYDVDKSVRRVNYGKKRGSRSERYNAQRDAEAPVRQSSSRVTGYENGGFDYERHSLDEQKKERPVRKRSQKASSVSRKADKKQTKADKKDQKVSRKRREKPEKRQKVSHSRDTMKLNVPYDYPKDPYADFKRPDLDEVIRNANERDRINRKNL